MADLPRLLATLRDVLRALDDLAAPHMLVGGVALAAWAPPRATADLDIVLAVPAADLDWNKHTAWRLARATRWRRA